VEKMLYVALVSNLMTAIGAAPVMAGPTSRTVWVFPAGVHLDLLPFGSRRYGTSCTGSVPRAWNSRTRRALSRLRGRVMPVRADEALPRGPRESRSALPSDGRCPERGDAA